jgi:homoserine acetyltransferase
MASLLHRNRLLLRPLIQSSKCIRIALPSLRHQSTAVPEPANTPSPPPSSQALSFPCLDTLDVRTANLRKNPPPKQVDPANPLGLHSGHETFYSPDQFVMDHGGVLPEIYVAYETWGTLNADKSNAILLHTGLSASSHAKSHSKNQKEGWWEHVIGPGKPLDTNKYYIICTNPIGGCFGSSGPSSIHPHTQRPYATTFPIVTIFDMVRAQFKLLDFLGIQKLFASVGNSMGGMQSLAAGVLGGEDRVGRIVSVSAAARSFPSSIAMRFVQRQGIPHHLCMAHNSTDGGSTLE